MMIDIFNHTPTRVWLLLAALIGLGLSQTVARQVALRRVTVLPLVLLGLSLSGVVTAFRAEPNTLSLALAAWAIGFISALTAGRRWAAPRCACWLPELQRLQLPGSWLPMGLIVGLFCIKYAVGVSLAMHPQWAAAARFAAPIGFVYGAFSGLFLARAAALWLLARRAAPASSNATIGAV